jgi:hypothetical protein
MLSRNSSGTRMLSLIDSIALGTSRKTKWNASLKKVEAKLRRTSSLYISFVLMPPTLQHKDISTQFGPNRFLSFVDREQLFFYLIACGLLSASIANAL